jgi:hypothetical protein
MQTRLQTRLERNSPAKTPAPRKYSPTQTQGATVLAGAPPELRGGGARQGRAERFPRAFPRPRRLNPARLAAHQEEGLARHRVGSHVGQRGRSGGASPNAGQAGTRVAASGGARAQRRGTPAPRRRHGRNVSAALGRRALLLLLRARRRRTRTPSVRKQPPPPSALTKPRRKRPWRPARAPASCTSSKPHPPR